MLTILIWVIAIEITFLLIAAWIIILGISRTQDMIESLWEEDHDLSQEIRRVTSEIEDVLTSKGIAQ